MSMLWIFRLCLLQSWLIQFCLIVVGSAVASDQRPNVVWITSEDNSCYLGCYGDQHAVTPNLDRLAPLRSNKKLISVYPTDLSFGFG